MKQVTKTSWFQSLLTICYVCILLFILRVVEFVVGLYNRQTLNAYTIIKLPDMQLKH